MKHTPGPWRFVNRGPRNSVIEGSNGEGVVTWARWPPDSCEEGDKALIVAAPELRDALAWALDRLQREVGLDCPLPDQYVYFTEEDKEEWRKAIALLDRLPKEGA